MFYFKNALSNEFAFSLLRSKFDLNPTPVGHCLSRSTTLREQGSFLNDNGGREERPWELRRLFPRKYTSTQLSDVLLLSGIKYIGWR